MMDHLQKFVDDKGNIGKTFISASGKKYVVSKIDNFEYTDPIDHSVTKNQVFYCYFTEANSIKKDCEYFLCFMS